MADERELREWHKYRRQSRQALTVEAAWALGLTALLAVVHDFVGGLHFALWAVVLFFGWFGFIGDLINVVVLSRCIARAEQDQSSRVP